MSAAWFTIEEASRWLDVAAEAVAQDPFAKYRLADIAHAKSTLGVSRAGQLGAAIDFRYAADVALRGAYPDCKARVLCFCATVLQARVDAMDAEEERTMT